MTTRALYRQYEHISLHKVISSERTKMQEERNADIQGMTCVHAVA